MYVPISTLSEVSVTVGVTTHGDVRDAINAMIDGANGNFSAIATALSGLDPGGGGISGSYVASVARGTVGAETIQLDVTMGSADGPGAVTHVTLPAATASTAGLMTAADKAKLDGLTPGGGGGTLPSNALVSGAAVQAGASSLLLRLKQADGGYDDVQLPVAVEGYAGLMSSADKAKLDGLSPGGGGAPARYITYCWVPEMGEQDDVPGIDTATQMALGTRVVVSGSEQTMWNFLYSATADYAGLMSTADKEKLDGLPDIATAVTSINESYGADAETMSFSFRLSGEQQDRSVRFGAATKSTAGMMTAADKAKLDGLPAAATVVTNLEGTELTVNNVKLKYKLQTASGSSADDYSVMIAAATGDTAGVMSSTDKRSLDGLAARAAAAAETLAAAPATAAEGQAELEARVAALEAAVRALLGI